LHFFIVIAGMQRVEIGNAVQAQHGNCESMTVADVLFVGDAGSQPRRINVIAGITGRTGHSSGAARAGVVADPGAFRVGLANPALIRALHAFHGWWILSKADLLGRSWGPRKKTLAGSRGSVFAEPKGRRSFATSGPVRRLSRHGLRHPYM
jgi:hypothetical protein